MKTYKKALKDAKNINIGDFITFPQSVMGQEVVLLFKAKGIELEIAHYTDSDVRPVLETRRRVPFGIFRVKNVK